MRLGLMRSTVVVPSTARYYTPTRNVPSDYIGSDVSQLTVSEGWGWYGVFSPLLQPGASGITYARRSSSS